jgi:hypothetical protein
MHRHTRSPAAAASLRLLAASVALLSLLACSDAPAPPAEASGQLPQLERLPLIGGVDADNDGVRDDIADHIRKTYTDPVQYRAAMQMARAYQLALLTDLHDAIALRGASDAAIAPSSAPSVRFQVIQDASQGAACCVNWKA